MILRIVRLPFVIVLAPVAAVGLFVLCFIISLFNHSAGQEMFRECFNVQDWRKWIWG